MITVDTKELNKAITFLNKIILKKDILFGNVKIEADNGTLTLVGNKPQGKEIAVSILVELPCLGELDEVVIPFDVFSRKYTGETVDIQPNKKGIQIRNGNLKLDLSTVNKFPNNDFEQVTYREIDTDLFKQATKFLGNATGGTETKYNTVYFRDDNCLTSNGQTFARFRNSIGFQGTILIDQLHTLTGMIQKKDRLFIGQTGNFLYAKINDVIIKLRLLNVLDNPTEPQLNGEILPIETSRVELLQAVKESIGENVALILAGNQISILSTLNMAQSEVTLTNVQSTNGYIKTPKKTLETLLNTMSGDVFKGEIVLSGNYQILRVVEDDFAFYIAGLVR